MMFFFALYILFGAGVTLGALIGDELSSLDFSTWEWIDWKAFLMTLFLWPLMIWLKLSGRI